MSWLLDTNVVSELFCEPASKLEYVSIQNLSRETWHFASHHARVERDAELDWVAGGFGSSHAILIGDTLYAPGGDRIRQLLPPPALLWASVGRLAVPPAADTTARASGDTLRADIGRDPVWRVTFVGDRLARLERIEGGRVAEWIRRSPEGTVEYEHIQSGRSLRLRVTRTEEVPEFDASIWRR